jgi:hypothetical protein
MAEVSQNTKYVKLDDGVSFSLVRTNPKLTTNTKLMYNGKKMYMESYASSELMNRSAYKNVPVKPNGTFNKDIASFLTGSGSQAYSIYQNFSDVAISDSYDNQFETLYWCGAEYIDSSFYNEEIGFVAPLYLREKLPNYFVIFRLDTPSNYNFTDPDADGNPIDSNFDFKTDILDKAVLIKTFDLREGSVLGKYIHNYIDQDAFEFDKSMYVNFSNGEVTYYGINKVDGVLEKKVENFENELQKNDNPVLYDDKWFTEGFERNNLIFPYIMNIEYLFDDDAFKGEKGESYDFVRYIGVYCNNIEFGEFVDLKELKESNYTDDNAIYYFEDNKSNLHRYINCEDGLSVDGKDSKLFDERLISGFEKERVTGYAEPLDVYEGYINRAQYGFEILKPLEPGDWVGIEYDGKVECYFADNKNGNGYFGEKHDMNIGEYSDFRFSVSENSTVDDIAEALVKSVNRNKKSKFEARCTNNVVVFYAKREGKEYNGSEKGGVKMLMEASLLYNKKISLPISNAIYVSENVCPIEHISDIDNVIPTPNKDGILTNDEKSLFGDYYIDYFCGACNTEIDPKTDTYKNVFKIYSDEYVFFDINRYLKTNNGDGRRICTNMIYINAEGIIDSEYRIVIVDDAPEGKKGNYGYDISVSSTYQVEIMDKFKPNHGVLSWFPVKDFDFDINYSSYGQYGAFKDECDTLSKKVIYEQLYHTKDTYADSDILSTQEDSILGLKELAKSPFFDDSGKSLDTEYDYYFEQYHPELCLMSKTVPFISKWGYYDEQKDSCENPYRLNVSKIFGVSNLSANTYLRKCDENEYTHSMPYYMTMVPHDYYTNYQYISTDEIYSKHYIDNENEYVMSISDGGENFKTFFDCVDYWINMFKNTDVDMFSHFFIGKKYGKRFDRKYSRLMCGDKFNNPSTLFRGVKFEAVRQYNGVEKRSSEYNDYKFSFVYIPVMLNSMIFNSTVHFVKNDTFKFIVGIIFVNTMLGKYEHNIFGGNIDYFNKGFIYAACKDIIRPENNGKNTYNLTLTYKDTNIGKNGIVELEEVESDFWEEKYEINNEENKFYMWIGSDKETVFITKTINVTSKSDIVGEFHLKYDSNNNDGMGIDNIGEVKTIFTFDGNIENGFKILWERYHDDYDVTIYGFKTFEIYGEIVCKMNIPDISFEDLILIDVCNIEWNYFEDNWGYSVDVSNIHLKSESLQNILINMGVSNSIRSIEFFDSDIIDRDGVNDGVISFVNRVYDKDGKLIAGDCDINVDTINGNISIINVDKNKYTKIESYDGNVENLRMNITIKDRFDINSESLGLKDYFSVFNQLSMYSITDIINRDYNVKYYSTVEDNKYKIRVIEPDCIEVEDKYEAFPVKITQNNKSVVGSVEIKEKQDVDKIGVKVINRYSGYYNPIFNDILYYDDYTYTKSYDKLKTVEKFELPYSNTHIDYNYSDGYGEFGVIRNMYYHKTNISRSDKILTSENPVYPAINEYALEYRDYNIFSSSWDEGYFMTQDDLENISICDGIGSMKDSLCMFGSKYLNLPDNIFIDTFENGELWDESVVMDIRDNTDIEIMYKEVNNRSVVYKLFIEKRLKRYLKESLIGVFEKYINKNYSFGNKGTIEDDVDEYVEKNLLKLYKVDKVYMYIKSDRMRINDKKIENEYLKFVDKSNYYKMKNGFPVIDVENAFPLIEVKDGVVMKDSKFIMGKLNEYDRSIVYNLKPGFKESFGFGVLIKRK